MALPPADPARHRRALRRRALIGWLGGGAVIALVVLAGILGGGARKEEVITVPAHSAGLFDYHMTPDEYEALHPGQTQGEVLDQLGKVGLPEGQTQLAFIRLFPPHDESLVCSYWQIADSYTVARLCFAREDDVLRQKLEREVGGGLEGETTVRA